MHLVCAYMIRRRCTLTVRACASLFFCQFCFVTQYEKGPFDAFTVEHKKVCEHYFGAYFGPAESTC